MMSYESLLRGTTNICTCHVDGEMMVCFGGKKMSSPCMKKYVDEEEEE